MTILIYLFLIAVFFPYIKFFNIGTNTDTQFYSIILGLIIIIIYLINRKFIINKKYVQISTYMFFVIIVCLIVDIKYNIFDIGDFVRGIYGYVSIIIIPFASFISIKILMHSKLEKILKIFYGIWIGIGVLQIFNRNIFTGWRIRKVITSDRGVISLANEPAYFVIILLMITLILLIINYNKNKKYMILTILSSIVLAQNAVGVVYSILLYIVFNIKNINIKTLIKFITIPFIFIIALLIYINIDKDSRLTHLLSQLILNPLDLILTDISLNIRFAHVYISLKEFLSNCMMPHGVLAWGIEYYNNVISNPTLFIEPIYRFQNVTNKIVTMNGALLYEIGIFAIPMYLFLYKACKKIPFGKKIYIYIFLLGINGLNISNPAFLFLIGYILFFIDINIGRNGGNTNDKKVIYM